MQRCSIGDPHGDQVPATVLLLHLVILDGVVVPPVNGFVKIIRLGVVPAICTCVREFSQPGDEILFLTPVYGEFFDSVENWDRKPLAVSLIEEDDGRRLESRQIEGLGCRSAGDRVFRDLPSQ